MRDKISQNGNQEFIKKCISCGSFKHEINYCKHILYIPNMLRLIKRSNNSVLGQRKTFTRNLNRVKKNCLHEIYYNFQTAKIIAENMDYMGALDSDPTFRDVKTKTKGIENMYNDDVSINCQEENESPGIPNISAFRERLNSNSLSISQNQLDKSEGSFYTRNRTEDINTTAVRDAQEYSVFTADFETVKVFESYNQAYNITSILKKYNRIALKKSGKKITKSIKSRKNKIKGRRNKKKSELYQLY